MNLPDPAHAPPADPRDRGPKKRRLPWIVALLLGVGLVAATALAWRATARRKPILELLDRMSARTLAERQDARARLIAVPAATAPVLVRIVRHGKTRWQTEILPWFEAVPRIARHRAVQSARERNAVDVLQRMGAPAAPALLPLLAETRFGGRESAIALLRSYGASAGPVIVGALSHPNPELRAGAALTLGRFPPELIDTLAPLRRARSDADPGVRSAGIWALSQLTSRAAEVLPDLVAALDDPHPGVKAESLRGLRTMGSSGADAIPALRRVLRHSSVVLRAEAAQTLAQLGPAARQAEPELLGNLHLTDPLVVRQSAATLVLLDLHREESLAVLRRLLVHRDVAVRARTADLVGGLGARAALLVPDLQALLRNPETRDDRAAVAALRAIEPAAVRSSFVGIGNRGNPSEPGITPLTGLPVPIQPVAAADSSPR